MTTEQSNTRQVLALKYRPKRFEDLIGQDTISTTLALALDTNRLSHAYLFSGLRGSGKTSTARIMAKALVCDNSPTSKPCEVCQNCVSANNNRHLDIIEMDAASNRGIDDIKDLIEQTKYKPASAKFKVFIIDEVHMLTTQAFNALLKTLEEPPEFVKFILATTDPLKLPATILSRTQHFRFKRISDKNIVHHLSHILNVENIQFEPEALQILARSGQGSLRDTLTLLDQAIIFSKSIVTTSSVTDMMGMIDPSFLDKMFDVILNKNDIRPIVESLESYETAQVLDEISIYLKNKMLLNDVKFDIYMFDRFFRIIADSKQLLNMNSDSGFVLILTLSKFVEAVSFKTIDDVIENIDTIKARHETTINKVNTELQKVQLTQNEQNKTDQESKEKIENLVNSDKITVENIEDNSSILFKRLIANIYEKNYELGECFEKSFSLSSFENKILKLNSTAKGECKTLLYKHFAHIKNFIYDVFGEDIDLEFDKVAKEPKKDSARIIKATLPNQNEQNVKQINEQEAFSEQNLDQPSSCVASMSAMKNPTLAQKDLNIEDVKNSKMVNTIMNLFQSPNPPKINSKL